MREVPLCRIDELPAVGGLAEYHPEGRPICVAHLGSRLAAVDNVCPHRGGPLAESSVEEGKLLCPWHAWAFDLDTGQADHDGSQSIGVYRLRIGEGQVWIELWPA